MALILALYKLDQVRTIALEFRNMSIEVGLCFAGEKVFAARFKLGCKFKPLIFSLLQQAFTVSAVSRCFLPATSFLLAAAKAGRRKLRCSDEVLPCSFRSV